MKKRENSAIDTKSIGGGYNLVSNFLHGTAVLKRKGIGIILALMMCLVFAVPVLAIVEGELLDSETIFTSQTGETQEISGFFLAQDEHAVSIASVSNVTEIRNELRTRDNNRESWVRVVYANAPAVVTVLPREWAETSEEFRFAVDTTVGGAARTPVPTVPATTLGEINREGITYFRWANEPYTQGDYGYIFGDEDFMGDAGILYVPGGSTFVLDAGEYRVGTMFSNFVLIVSGESGEATPAQQQPAPLTTAVNVTINGIPQTFEVPPQIINDRTMLPLRAIGEALGMVVDFDNETRTATMTADGITVTHIILTNEITVNGVTSTFDVSSVIVDSRTLMPVRMLAEAIGAQVEWGGETRTAAITTN